MDRSYIDREATEYCVPDDWASYSRWRMQGSCNGLVCIYSPIKGRICVINPVTREFRDIQQPPKRTSKETQCLGFGYDSSSDDYKVVMAICPRLTTALVRILSLKSNIWKDFGQVNYRFEDSTLTVPGILFNGALHWFWNHNDSTSDKIFLVSFDLAKEEFKEIPQPNDTRYVWNLGYTLGIIQGRLCIFPAYGEQFYPSCGIWVMKSYNSWELFPNGSEMAKDHAIHYMIKDCNEYRITPPPTYFCDENTHLSRSKEHIPSPMFVPSLVSPYYSYNHGPSHTKINKITANAAGSLKEKREIGEVYCVEDKEEEKEIV